MAALQALYELDQSTHGLDAVIRWRAPELFRPVFNAHLKSEQAKTLLGLVGAPGKDLLVRLTVNEMVARGIESELAEAVHADLIKARPQAEYFAFLVRGVVENQAALDAAVAQIAPEWPVDQMALIDRNVLRIAIYEIAAEASPVKVAISEAVEMARAFSGEGSRRLVNGALGAFVSQGLTLEITSV